MIEKYIKVLENQLAEVDEYAKGKGNVVSKQQLIGWVGSTKGILERIFGKNSQKLTELENLRSPTYASGSVDKGEFIHASRLMIKSWIKELEILGAPISIDNPSDRFSLTIVQNQNQSQVVKLNVILDSVSDALTGTQRKEIEEIINNPEESTISKREKVFSKMKSFGSDVASNIIANILTNPGLYGG